LTHDGESVAVVIKPDPNLLTAEDQQTAWAFSRRLSTVKVRLRENTPQRAAAEAQATRIEAEITESPDVRIRERMGPAAESLAAQIRSRGVPLYGRDLTAAQEALKTGEEPRFSEPYMQLGGGRARGLNPISTTLSEEETIVLKSLIARAAGNENLFADHAASRKLRRLRARVKATPEPRRRLLGEAGSIELPVSVFQDVLDVGKWVEGGRGDEELQGCELGDLATLAVLLWCFQRRETLTRGWAFETDEDGGPVLVKGNAVNGPLPSQSDPDQHVTPGWQQSVLRLTRLGWFRADRGCKRIARGPRLVELDELRGVTYAAPERSAVAS
jgi:hypothetical protein